MNTEENAMNTGEWGVVEMLGHRVLAGRVVECKRFGAEGAVVSVPTVDGAPSWETFVAGNSIYAVTGCSEAQVLEHIRRFGVRPPAFLTEPARVDLLAQPKPDPLGMLEPLGEVVQADAGQADEWRGAQVVSELAYILTEPGAFLEFGGCRLAWEPEAMAYEVTSGDDSVVVASDLLAALRELRGLRRPDTAEADPDGQGRPCVVTDEPEF